MVVFIDKRDIYIKNDYIVIEVIKNVDLINEVDKYDVILVGTNTYHTMGNGFQRKVRTKYPEVYYLNTTTKYGDCKKLGTIISTIGVPVFTLCFITNGYNFRPDLTPVYLDYEALEKCIERVNQEFLGLNVATTMIGCSKFDGNGDSERVMKIINKNSNNINLYIYDYEQLDRSIENAIKYTRVAKNENYDRETKAQLLNQMIEDDKKLHSICDNNIVRELKIKEDIKKIIKNNKIGNE